MADALLSPQVGAGFIAAGGLALGLSARRLAAEPDDRRAPLMGVLGAFVFAAQMLNFSIPGTGSSGHLGGGLLLAILLGGPAGFVVMASVLVVQALWFADGGILAIGTNTWNLGFYPCFIGLLIYRLAAGRAPSATRLSAAVLLAAVIGLELGAASVALQTFLSGRSDLPFGRFAAVMLAIHLPIGLAEGLVTVAVLNLVRRIRPGLVSATSAAPTHSPALILLGLIALLCAGGLAWYSSDLPDGLEWSLARVSGAAPAAQPTAGDPGLAGMAGSLAVLALAGLVGYLSTRLRSRPAESRE